MKTKLLIIICCISVIFLVTSSTYAEESISPEPPTVEEVYDPNIIGEGFVPIHNPLPGFVVSGGLWYIVIGAVAGWIITWRLTSLGLPIISGIFIIIVGSFLLFPPLCNEIMNVFGNHCGIGELFYSLIPFSATLLCLGIILLIYYYKKNYSTSVIRK